jgi:hypothetical protein
VADGPTLLSYQTVAKIESLSHTHDVVYSTYDWNAINGVGRFNPFAQGRLVNHHNQTVDPEILGLHAWINRMLWYEFLLTLDNKNQ